MPTSRKPSFAISARLAVFSGKNPRQQFPVAGRFRGFERRHHRNLADPCPSPVTRNIDREFRDAGVTRAAAIGGGRCEGHELPVLFDHHDWMPAIEPGFDLLHASRLCLEGADPISDAFVVDPRNGFGVCRRCGPGRKRARHQARSYQLRERRTIRTTESMTGTSTSTPTTVASAAPD